MVNVSVIVPVLNRKDLVLRSLDSILNQTKMPQELIVVDNGSVDGTLETVARWMEQHKDTVIKFKLLSENKKGAFAARQKGLNESIGDYVIFFDSDDEMNPDLLEKAIEAVEEDKFTDIVCWKCRLHLLDGQTKVPPFDVKDPLENHLIHTLLRPQGYLVKRSFIEKAGGWGKNLKVWDDLELGLRLLLRNPKVKAVPVILANIHSTVESITGKDFSSKAGEWEITLDEMEKEAKENGGEKESRILKILNYRRAILAAHYRREGNNKEASRLISEAYRKESGIVKFILRFVYRYTSAGFRGAWRLVRFAY